MTDGQVRIRQFTVTDWPAATDIWEAAGSVEAPPLTEVVRKLERDPQLFLVAETDERLVGVVMGTYDGRRGWIFRLAVAPEQQRQGIGTMLVRELEHRFEELGVRHLRLLVITPDPAARAFWERLGYLGLDRVALYSKDTVPGSPRSHDG